MTTKKIETKVQLMEKMRHILRREGYICAHVRDLDTLAVEVLDDIDSKEKLIYIVKVEAAPNNFDWDKESLKYEKIIGDTLESDVSRLMDLAFKVLEEVGEKDY